MGDSASDKEAYQEAQIRCLGNKVIEISRDRQHLKAIVEENKAHITNLEEELISLRKENLDLRNNNCWCFY